MNAARFLDGICIGAQLAVGEQPKCPPGYCARLATCGDTNCPGHPAPDEVDDPFVTAEAAERWAVASLWAVGIFAASCIAGALIAFARY